MSYKHDYIPRNAVMLSDFARTMADYIQGKAGTGTGKWNIPAERIAEMSMALEDLSAAIRQRDRQPTPANREIVREAAKKLTGIIRGVANQYLRFPPVTNADRVAMGVPNHDTIRTDHAVVAENVDFVIRLTVARQLAVDFWIMGEARKAKPQGYDGAVIIWGVRDAPPAAPDELERHALASRTPYLLHFGEEERGRTCWIALCWQNERGITGAWSAYKSAVIP